MNQSLGVAAVDLSGPHEASPLPGHKVGAAYARYFLVLTIRLPPGDPSAESEVLQEEVKPLLYVALLSKKSEAPHKVMELLSQVRDEHGSLPHKLVYRLHSDRGLEFCNLVMADFLRLHAINQNVYSGI